MQNRLTLRILSIPRTQKRVIALIVDAILCVATVFIAYYLRLNIWSMPVGNQLLSYVAVLIFAIPLFIYHGFYRAIFRYAGWGALMAVVRACGLYGAIYAGIFTVISVPGVPRTIGIIQPILLFLAIGASRAFARYWLGGGYHHLLRISERRRVLIYGAGSAGRQLAGALGSSNEMQVIAFVDDDPTLRDSVLNGKRIYASKNLRKLVEELQISDLLLAIPSATRHRRNEILNTVRGTSASIRTLPGLMDLAHGRVTVNDLRELDIEDLLGRDIVPPNALLLGKNITDKVVMVTGAGGSIGSELCRQALSMRPKALILLEWSEYNLYSIHQELELRILAEDDYIPDIRPVLASVQDQVMIDGIIGKWLPDTIYHAAAYKHVPLVEHNPLEGVRNNVFGTRAVARMALKHGVKDFVLISTDKAVRPTNIMGATKRFAEQILQAMAADQSTTRFSIVRFGNVLGSSGSVVPLFRNQIRAGGPITITHEDITRYFMTIPEAAQLVIQAGAMAHGGEVFVLDMGEPVRIADLARRMVELSGLTVRDQGCPDGDIEVNVVGLRPGEKLYEELLIGNNPMKTSHQRIYKANEEHSSMPKLEKVLKQFTTESNQDEIELQLQSIVPEFRRVATDMQSFSQERSLYSTTRK